MAYTYINISYRKWHLRTKLFVMFLIIFWMTVNILIINRYFFGAYNNQEHVSFGEILKSINKDQYQAICFKNKFVPKLEMLQHNLYLWKNSTISDCRQIYEKLNLMYKIEVKSEILHWPPDFGKKMKTLLGHNEELYKSWQNQEVLHIKHLFSYEHSAYNSIRAKRPKSPSNINGKDYLSKLLNETVSSCDFCKPLQFTAEEVHFGRIIGKHSLTAANSFKIDKWHGLFLTKKHDMISVSEEEFLDLFNTSHIWFKNVNAVDLNAKYPVMFWDMLPHAGASQAHVHIHGLLGSDSYHGKLGELLHVIQTYQTVNNNHNYWSDFITIHKVLGLVVQLEEAIAIAPLTSIKDYEIIIISEKPTANFYRLFYLVVQTYQNKLQKFCFSSGMALPALRSKKMQYPSLPAYIRIGTRGECSSMTSDVSSLELYTMYNINADPYKMISLLQTAVDEIDKDSVISHYSEDL